MTKSSYVKWLERQVWGPHKPAAIRPFDAERFRKVKQELKELGNRK